MKQIRQGLASPALLVAVAALVAALAGTAFAERASTSAVSKKKVRKIATKQINRLAPGLAVASADEADHASSADTATRADTAATAVNAANAANANRLGGATLSELIEVDQGFDSSCEPSSGGGFTDCTPGAEVTVTRRSDILVVVTATWYSDEGVSANVQTDCRLEQNDQNISAVGTFGTDTNDTVGGSYERSIAWSDLAEGNPPGTYRYELSCERVESVSSLADVYVHALAVPS